MATQPRIRARRLINACSMLLTQATRPVSILRSSSGLDRRAALRGLTAAGISLCVNGVTRVWAMAAIKPDASCALIVIDVQNCFVTGGTLAVKSGEAVVPVINKIAPAFKNVVLTQDWHPAGHVSFASNHPGTQPYQTLTLAYGQQVLWPDHCVQGTNDAALVKGLHIPQAELILRKGFHQDVDSYSAFEEADRKTPTGLEAYLKQRGIKTLFVTGLATDFCVAWTALDARNAGFETYVVEDACRGIDLNGSLAAAWKAMLGAGVKRIHSSAIQTG